MSHIETRTRCTWANSSPLMAAYHDDEWGIPVHDDTKLFELLILEGAQAGLSWNTVLIKRDNYRKAFVGFDPVVVAGFGPDAVVALLANPGIIRNRLKIASTISNAQKFLEIQREFGSFDKFIWRFVDSRPVVNGFSTLADMPARTALSDAMSKDLQKRGFRFVGSTICYAFMQSAGMVNDHTLDCFRRTAG